MICLLYSIREIALLQDIGFTVEDVDLSLGFMKAVKRAPYEMSFTEGAKNSVNIFSATPIYQIISLSITAKQISDGFYELKSNFAYELWGLGGGLSSMRLVLMKENPVTDPNIYQSFYAKLRSSIELESLSR